jgi:hypothetical protein
MPSQVVARLLANVTSKTQGTIRAASMHNYGKTSARILATSFDLHLIGKFRGLHIGVLYIKQDLHTWRDIDNVDIPNDSIH